MDCNRTYRISSLFFRKKQKRLSVQRVIDNPYAKLIDTIYNQEFIVPCTTHSLYLGLCIPHLSKSLCLNVPQFITQPQEKQFVL